MIRYDLIIGYRTWKNMFKYIEIYKKESNKENIKEIIDIQIEQKILPKFNGLHHKTEPCLRAMLSWILGYDREIDQEEFRLKLNEVDEKDIKYVKSFEKLKKMWENFIEFDIGSFYDF